MKNATSTESAVDRFCCECGVELKKVELHGFNTKTGERNFKMCCPTKKCGHTGHELHVLHEWFTGSDGFFSSSKRHLGRCMRQGCDYSFDKKYVPAIDLF